MMLQIWGLHLLQPPPLTLAQLLQVLVLLALLLELNLQLATFLLLALSFAFF